MDRIRQSVRRRLDAAGRDEGAALVAVLGIMMVMAILTATVTSMTLFNSEHTVETRSGVRAQAAADAGLDRVLSQLEGKSFAQLSTVCSQTLTVDTVPVEVTTRYALTSGGSVVCPTAAQGPYVSGLTVTATARVAPVIGSEPVERSTVIDLLPTPPQMGLDHAIFGESSLTITNDADINESSAGASDAHVYTNGGLNCMTQAGIQGEVYAAQGDVVLWDNCKIASDVWARGKVTMKSNTLVDGDVYAASDAATWSVLLENNNARVNGSILTNGGVSITDGSHQVTGSVFARTGQIALYNGADIGGSAYARGNISLRNGSVIGRDALSLTGSITRENSNNKVTGDARAGGVIAPLSPNNFSVGGQYLQNQPGLVFPSAVNPSALFPAGVGFPTQIQPPQREAFPRILANKTDLLLWQAAGWDILTFNGICGENVMTEIKKDRPTKTVLVFEGCTSPIALNSNATPLNNHRAIVSESGFTSQNNMNFSVQGNGMYYLYLIQPAYSAGVTWTADPATGQLKPSCPASIESVIDRFKPDDVHVLIYSPCKFTWMNMHPNGEPYNGQIYAGGLSLPPSFVMNMSQIPVPGLSDGTPNPASPSNMVLQSRYDIPS